MQLIQFFIMYNLNNQSPSIRQQIVSLLRKVIPNYEQCLMCLLSYLYHLKRNNEHVMKLLIGKNRSAKTRIVLYVLPNWMVLSHHSKDGLNKI